MCVQRGMCHLSGFPISRHSLDINVRNLYQQLEAQSWRLLQVPKTADLKEAGGWALRKEAWGQSLYSPWFWTPSFLTVFSFVILSLISWRGGARGWLGSQLFGYLHLGKQDHMIDMWLPGPRLLYYGVCVCVCLPITGLTSPKIFSILTLDPKESIYYILLDRVLSLDSSILTRNPSVILKYPWALTVHKNSSSSPWGAGFKRTSIVKDRW